MQHGEYVTDRWLVRAIQQICQERDITLKCYSDDWILEIHQANTVGRIFGYKFSLNNSASANLAQDKVGAYEVLAAANVPAVEHRLLRTKAGRSSFPQEWDEFVLKPLIGTSGHLVQSFTDQTEARYVMEKSGVEAWAVSPRLAIQNETRIIILDDHVLLSYKKHPQKTDRLKMYNLGKGAVPEDILPTNSMVELAMCARRALGLRVCAVDIVEIDDGRQIVLEVNDGIMMEYYSRYSKTNQEHAYNVYEKIISAMIDE